METKSFTAEVAGMMGIGVVMLLVAVTLYHASKTEYGTAIVEAISSFSGLSPKNVVFGAMGLVVLLFGTIPPILMLGDAASEDSRLGIIGVVTIAIGCVCSVVYWLGTFAISA
jgi:hypothetical protein